jgi:hypothetical protein
MGLFDFLSTSGVSDQDDGHGELYEVCMPLGTEEKPEQRKERVASLLSTWYRQYERYGYKNTAPTFSFEIHALNDDSSERKPIRHDKFDDDVILDNPMDGYGTYVFVPESMRQSTVSVIGNIFTEPIDIPDDFDVLKVLAKTYVGEYEQEQPPIYTRELTAAQPEYYPLESWDAKAPVDQMNEIFGVFERLKKGEFAGISIPCRMASPDWKIEGNMRIREIEDPNYIAHPTFFQRVVNVLNDGDGQKQMGGRVDRLAGYEKQSLDYNETAEVQAIKDKQLADTFRCTIRVYASREDVADELCSVIRQRTSGRWNHLRIASTRISLDDLAQRRIGRNSFIMSSDEIASMWHVPDDGNHQFNRLHKAQPQISTPPESVVIVPSGGDGDIKALLKQYLKSNEQVDGGGPNQLS